MAQIITVCVTRAGAGVDSAWEQKKLEVRKMLEKPQNPQRPSMHALLGSFLLCQTRSLKKETAANLTKLSYYF
jgi:hypothetical protein